MEISPKSMMCRRKIGFQVKPIDLSRRQCPHQNLRCPRFTISARLNETRKADCVGKNKIKKNWKMKNDETMTTIPDLPSQFRNCFICNIKLLIPAFTVNFLLTRCYSHSRIHIKVCSLNLFFFFNFCCYFNQ